MKTQHTPGPWAIAANMYGIGNLRVEGVEVSRDGITQPIANCGWDHRGESAANARLIAAAPDGLALAHAVMASPQKCYCKYMTWPPGPCSRCLAKKLISRATGDA